MTTRDDLFLWMSRHRVAPKGCSRCGLAQLAYWRDGQEQPVGSCCINRGVYEAHVDLKAISRRLHALNHDCPAEGCLACMEA